MYGGMIPPRGLHDRRSRQPALVERELQNQSIMQMGNMVMNHQSSRSVRRNGWKSGSSRKRLDPERFRMNQEERQAVSQRPPPEAPQVTVSQDSCADRSARIQDRRRTRMSYNTQAEADRTHIETMSPRVDHSSAGWPTCNCKSRRGSTSTTTGSTRQKPPPETGQKRVDNPVGMREGCTCTTTRRHRFFRHPPSQPGVRLPDGHLRGTHDRQADGPCFRHSQRRA